MTITQRVTHHAPQPTRQKFCAAGKWSSLTRGSRQVEHHLRTPGQVQRNHMKKLLNRMAHPLQVHTVRIRFVEDNTSERLPIRYMFSDRNILSVTIHDPNLNPKDIYGNHPTTSDRGRPLILCMHEPSTTDDEIRVSCPLSGLSRRVSD
jgi:hypothetical protein